MPLGESRLLLCRNLFPVTRNHKQCYQNIRRRKARARLDSSIVPMASVHFLVGPMFLIQNDISLNINIVTLESELTRCP